MHSYFSVCKSFDPKAHYIVMVNQISFVVACERNAVNK